MRVQVYMLINYTKSAKFEPLLTRSSDGVFLLKEFGQQVKYQVSWNQRVSQLNELNLSKLRVSNC